jgi:hypothetical protein
MVAPSRYLLVIEKLLPVCRLTKTITLRCDGKQIAGFPAELQLGLETRPLQLAPAIRPT